MDNCIPVTQPQLAGLTPEAGRLTAEAGRLTAREGRRRQGGRMWREGVQQEGEG